MKTNSKYCWVAVLASTCMMLCTVLGSEESSPDIYFLHIKSDIKYRFATTLVTSKVVNPDDVSKEVIFDVTLPNEAFMTNFTLEINNTIHIGEVKEKEAAKRQYEHARNRGQSAGYIGTKPRETNKFNIKVNVEAMQSVVFNLTYKEILRRKTGKYCHVIYIDPGQPVEEFQIEVAIQESRDITTLNVPPIRDELLTNVIISDSGTNNVAVINRPTARSAYILYRPSIVEQTRSSESGISGQFVVEYDVNRDKDAGDLLVVNGYFVHFFAPEGYEPLPKDVLFILDKSGSMSGRKISQLKEAMLNILNDIQEEDRFNIMTFDGSISYWRQGELIEANEDNINDAKQFVNDIIADGSTDIDESMTEGIKLLSSQSSRERARVLIFLTDGQPTSGETNSERILKNVRKYNEIDIPVFSLAFGAGADYSFIKKMAAQNNGFGRKIYEDSDAALQITGFYNEISTVLLKNVTFTYLDGEVLKGTLTDVKFNTFFEGTEIIIAGRLSDTKQHGPMTCIIKVDGTDGLFNLTKPNEIILNKGLNDFEKISEQVWAYLTIKQKLKQKDASTNETEQEKLKQQIIEMSLKYNFVTPLTSMVVTLDDESETQPLDDKETRHTRERIQPLAKMRHAYLRTHIVPPSSSMYAHNPVPFSPQQAMYDQSGNMLGFPGFGGFNPLRQPIRFTPRPRRPTTALPSATIWTSSTIKPPMRTTTAMMTTTTSTRKPPRRQRTVSTMFVVRVFGISNPLCVDDDTLAAGNTSLVFESSKAEVTVYGHTGSNGASSRRNRRRRRQKNHFTRINAEFLTPRHSLNFKIDSYTIDRTSHSWTDDQFTLSDFNSNITFPLVIHRSKSSGVGLRLYADVSSLPRDIGGIIGKFALMRGKVIKRKNKKRKIIGKIKIRNLNNVQKYKAKLISDPVNGVPSCWLLKKFKFVRP